MKENRLITAGSAGIFARSIASQAKCSIKSRQGIEMSQIVYLDTAMESLKELLESLPFGETLTIVSADGSPLGILVSLNTELGIEAPQEPDIDVPQEETWESRWSDFASEVERAWKDDTSAKEILSEMRR